MRTLVPNISNFNHSEGVHTKIRRKKKENNDENSSPLTSLPVNRMNDDQLLSRVEIGLNRSKIGLNRVKIV